MNYNYVVFILGVNIKTNKVHAFFYFIWAHNCALGWERVKVRGEAEDFNLSPKLSFNIHWYSNNPCMLPPLSVTSAPLSVTSVVAMIMYNKNLCVLSCTVTNHCRLAAAGHRLAVAGHHLAVTGHHRLAVAGHCLTVAGSRLAVAGPRLAVAGSRLAVAGPRLTVAGPRLTVAGPRLAVAGPRLTVGGMCVESGTLITAIHL